MALKGIKVIEFAGLAPGPFCGKVLRDLGARVIRIDKTGPQIDIDQLSHGKESIALNLRTPKGIEIARKLADNADVLIEPFRKGVMERLGLGPSILLATNPKLIYARLTGYGQYGELSARAGHDINYISYSGVLSTLGRAKDKPYAPMNLIADFAGGGLMCALAILSALYERSTSSAPKGKVIDCSMVEGSAYVSSWLWTSKKLPFLWAGTSRGTNLLDGGYHAYETYETKDAKYMSCGPLEPQFYAEFLTKLGLKESEEEVNHEVLEKKFKTKTQAEWSEIFKDSDACVSPVLDLESAPLHPHNVERKSFIKLEDSTYLPTMNWLDIDSSSRGFKRPLIGQDTRAVLSELKLSSKEIEELEEKKVIESASVNKKSKL